MNSNFALTLGYLNPPLNNPAKILFIGKGVQQYYKESFFVAQQLSFVSIQCA